MQELNIRIIYTYIRLTHYKLFSVIFNMQVVHSINQLSNDLA
jgi:hypothetical protein